MHKMHSVLWLYQNITDFTYKVSQYGQQTHIVIPVREYNCLHTCVL